MSRKIIILLMILVMLSSLLFVNFDLKNDFTSYHQHKVALKEDISKTGISDDGTLKTHLPIIIINNGGKEIPGRYESDKRRLKCAYDVIDNDNKINISTAKPTLSGYMEISIRGNSSRDLPKKQYSIKIVDEKSKSKSEMLLGMPYGSSWALNGSYIDKSLIRNYMLLNLSSEIIGYSPRCRFCEVMVSDANGNLHYEGVYTLIEKPKVNKNRINLSLYDKKYTQTSYMVQMNRAIDHKRLYHLKPDDMFAYYYDLEYPSTNDITNKSLNYIQQDLFKCEKVLYDALHTKNWKNVDKYFDIDKFVDYYIINEFFQNYDAGTLSTFLYKNTGKKLTIGPVWDFDSSFDNYRLPTKRNVIKLHSNYYFYFLSQNPEFVRKCHIRYIYLRKTVFSDENLIEYIDSTANYLGTAADRNADRWYKGDRTLFKKDIDKMKNYVKERGKWMDENFIKMSKVISQEGNQ